MPSAQQSSCCQFALMAPRELCVLNGTSELIRDHFYLYLQLSRLLRNFNITKISDLELISNTTDRLDITFHFFGIKGDSQRIREAITRMVERGRIGNFTLVSNFHHFDENPPLNMLVSVLNRSSLKFSHCHKSFPWTFLH